jgi:RNA polymerase sigma-70 factor (ECF subfamily)
VPDPRREIEQAAREAYGRLAALLARRAGDLQIAEDALGDALLKALETWPQEGIPANPVAWLHTASRRNLVGVWRKAEVRDRKAVALEALQGLEQEGDGWPDARLRMLFVCAHPALDPGIRAPLMLQSVLGLSAEEISERMLLPPKTLGQRLWRAKQKIREARIPFVTPELPELPARIGAVLDAIYGLYGAGWSMDGAAVVRAEEALWLSSLVRRLLPGDAEVQGLHALLCYAEARRAARLTDDGVYVPLSEQNTGRWSAPLLAQAREALRAASALRVVGPFQLEAAIQDATVEGLRQGRPDPEALALLYEGLFRLSPTLASGVGRAVALAEVRGPQAGLDALDALSTQGVDYQPYWAARAALLDRASQPAAAREAYLRAIERTREAPVQAFLQGRLAALPR